MIGSIVSTYASVLKAAISSAALLSLVCLIPASYAAAEAQSSKKSSVLKILKGDRDFSGMDLSNINLAKTGIRMSNSNFERADLSGANLTRINVRDSSFRGANLKGAVLLRTEFDDSDLSGADLRGADLTRACLCPSNLTGANLEGATLIRADFYNAVLKDANFRNADLSGANFKGADLSGADFTGAKLVDVKYMEEAENRDRAIGLK